MPGELPGGDRPGELPDVPMPGELPDVPMPGELPVGGVKLGDVIVRGTPASSGA
jgi:hypothetical protein